MYNLNHEHIVKLYNHYEDDDNFYLILQYCSKGQLYTMLKREGRLNERVTA
jgi:aurora kinase